MTNRAGRRFGKALDKVPVKDVMTWPITFLNVDKARAMWKEGPTSEFHMTGCVACSGCRHTRRRCVTVRDLHLRRYFNHVLQDIAEKSSDVGDDEAFQAWVTITSRTLIDSLWGHYWVTGDTGCVCC